MAFAEWLRINSQHYLLEASEREMAEKYLGAAPPLMGGGVRALFWRRVFVQVVAYSTTGILLLDSLT